MSKIISAVALTGWAAIVWIAWHLANARIATCGAAYDQAAANCILRAQADRDNVLTGGLVVALAFVILILFIAARNRVARIAPASGWTAANRAEAPRLR